MKSIRGARVAIAALLVMLAAPMLARGRRHSAPRGIQAGREFLDSRLHRSEYQRGIPARRAQPRRRLRHPEIRRRRFIARAAAHWSMSGATDTSRHCGASSRRCRPKQGAKHCRPKTNACSRCGVRTRAPSFSRTRPTRIRFPARPGRSLQGRPDPLLELGSPHRRDLRQPGTAARARGAAARGVVVQCGGLLEGGRRGSVAVHAVHRPALHARRRCGGRASRSVPLDRSRGPTTGLQLPRARQLAAGAHRVQPWRRRHAPRQGIRGHRRFREDQSHVQQPHVRLRVAQFLSVVPGGAHRSTRIQRNISARSSAVPSRNSAKSRCPRTFAWRLSSVLSTSIASSCAR